MILSGWERPDVEVERAESIAVVSISKSGRGMALADARCSMDATKQAAAANVKEGISC